MAHFFTFCKVLKCLLIVVKHLKDTVKKSYLKFSNKKMFDIAYKVGTIKNTSSVKPNGF